MRSTICGRASAMRSWSAVSVLNQRKNNYRAPKLAAGLGVLDIQRGELSVDDESVVIERERPRNPVGIEFETDGVSRRLFGLVLVFATVEVTDGDRPPRYRSKLRFSGRGVVVITFLRRDLVTDDGERIEDFVARLRTVIDRKIQHTLAGARGLDHAHHMFGRKHNAGSKAQTFWLRLLERHGRLGRLAYRAAVHRIDQIFVDKILRREFETLGIGAFPRRRAQVACGHPALAAIELRDLPEFERIALAGVAAKIIENAAAHARYL